MFNTTINRGMRTQVYRSGVINSYNANVFDCVPKSASKYLAYKGVQELLKKRPTRPMKALDFGCGLGDSTNLLSRLGYQAVGVDHDPQMIRIAKERQRDTRFVNVSGESLPFGKNHFDLIYSSFVVLEMSSIISLVNYFKTAYDVLSDAGKMIIVTANPAIYDPQRSWLALKADEKNVCFPGNKVSVKVVDADVSFDDYFWTESELKLAAAAAGFKVSKTLYQIGRAHV